MRVRPEYRRHAGPPALVQDEGRGGGGKVMGGGAARCGEEGGGGVGGRDEGSVVLPNLYAMADVVEGLDVGEDDDGEGDAWAGGGGDDGFADEAAVQVHGDDANALEVVLRRPADAKEEAEH